MAATPDMELPVYPASAGELQSIAEQAWATEPRLKLVARNAHTHQDRYVQRTAIMAFPDTISVRFIGLEPGKASLAIYSRSQVGYSDLGVNKARVLCWLSLLRAKVDSQRN